MEITKTIRWYNGSNHGARIGRCCDILESQRPADGWQVHQMCLSNPERRPRQPLPILMLRQIGRFGLGRPMQILNIHYHTGRPMVIGLDHLALVQRHIAFLTLAPFVAHHRIEA